MNELTREVVVRCSVERAFDAFVTRIDAWWPESHRKEPGSTLRFEPRVGGRLVERFSEGERELGSIVAWEPPEHLSYTWWPGALARPTQVEVRFEAEGEATRVRIVHSEGESGLGEKWPERAALFERGWGTVLPAYASYVEGES